MNIVAADFKEAFQAFDLIQAPVKIYHVLLTAPLMKAVNVLGDQQINETGIFHFREDSVGLVWLRARDVGPATVASCPVALSLRGIADELVMLDRV